MEQILYSRATGVETWITSDGRAYFVRLHEDSGSESTLDLNGGEDDGAQVRPQSHAFAVLTRND